jgi:hypothetical protein
MLYVPMSEPPAICPLGLGDPTGLTRLPAPVDHAGLILLPAPSFRRGLSRPPPPLGVPGLCVPSGPGVPISNSPMAAPPVLDVSIANPEWPLRRGWAFQYRHQQCQLDRGPGLAHRNRRFHLGETERSDFEVDHASLVGGRRSRIEIDNLNLVSVSCSSVMNGRVAISDDMTGLLGTACSEAQHPPEMASV